MTDSPSPEEQLPDPNESGDLEVSHVSTIIRSTVGGFLMGLANLVPGISGGTMLLAAGIYPDFISSLSQVTRFRFRFRSLLILGCVGLAAGIGILFFAGVLKDMVINHRWVMYSLFIGLTLGGLPVVWRFAHPVSPRFYVAALFSFSCMAGLARLQALGVIGHASPSGTMYFLAGLAGASAMILPGISGGYVLLLMGQYVPILDAIDRFKDALGAGDLTAAREPAISVLVPVGIGVVTGVVAVGNLLEWLLRRYRVQTLGVLIGLLLGSTCLLWPFQSGVAPKLNDVVKGRLVTQETIRTIDQEDWPTEMFRPTTTQVASSLGLIAVGISLTVGLAMVGRSPQRQS